MNNYQTNHEILAQALSSYGHNISEDGVKVDLDWLAEQGLVKLSHVDVYVIVQATSRGQDVAEGKARVSGIARNKPGSV